MIYDFENEQGEIEGFDFPMEESPAIGEVIEMDGARWRRLASVPDIGRTKSESFVSYAAPSKKNAELWGMPPAPEYNEDGLACFTSKRQARDYGKSCEREDGEIVYDD